jgi:hypothetical protein
VMAGGYILLVPLDRRDELLDEARCGGSYYRSKPSVAEPVPRFDHSSRAPLVVFASFENNYITHIAKGRKGVYAGTGLVRLNLDDLQPLKQPVSFDEILADINQGLARHVRQRLETGGLLPPKSLGAFVDRMLQLDKTISGRLERYSERRAQALRRLQPRARENLALQKDALGLALDIAGIPRDELSAWSPTDDPRSLLDGLTSANFREDQMLLSDFSTMPGFEAVRKTHYGSKVFASEQDRSKRLTVIMANRLPLEQQTGADLIYFNEAYKSFVMVQYKAMNKRDDEIEFRWQANDQFCDEVARMEALLAEIREIPSGDDPDGFRFSDNPFFLKFCPRVVFKPDDKGLFKGIYLPLDLWKQADAAGWFNGQRGGKVLTFRNVGRRINNSEFVGLVAKSWVGTSIEQSAVLTKIIREVVKTGKTVVYAFKHTADSAVHSETE